MGLTWVRVTYFARLVFRKCRYQHVAIAHPDCSLSVALSYALFKPTRSRKDPIHPSTAQTPHTFQIGGFLHLHDCLVEPAKDRMCNKGGRRECVWIWACRTTISSPSSRTGSDRVWRSGPGRCCWRGTSISKATSLRVRMGDRTSNTKEGGGKAGDRGAWEG